MSRLQHHCSVPDEFCHNEAQRKVWECGSSVVCNLALGNKAMHVLCHHLMMASCGCTASDVQQKHRADHRTGKRHREREWRTVGCLLQEKLGAATEEARYESILSMEKAEVHRWAFKRKRFQGGRPLWAEASVESDDDSPMWCNIHAIRTVHLNSYILR